MKTFREYLEEAIILEGIEYFTVYGKDYDEKKNPTNKAVVFAKGAKNKKGWTVGFKSGQYKLVGSSGQPGDGGVLAMAATNSEEAIKELMKTYKNIERYERKK